MGGCVIWIIGLMPFVITAVVITNGGCVIWIIGLFFWRHYQESAPAGIVYVKKCYILIEMRIWEFCVITAVITDARLRDLMYWINVGSLVFHGLKIRKSITVWRVVEVWLSMCVGKQARGPRIESSWDSYIFIEFHSYWQGEGHITSSGVDWIENVCKIVSPNWIRSAAISLA